MGKVKELDIDAERRAARAKMYAQLDKEVGKGLGRAVSDQELEPLVRQSFGSVGADYVAGGGVPYGRITELYGGEGSGKTTLGLSFLAQAQRAGFEAGLIDAECGFDHEWATLLGIDVPNLLLIQPDNGEQGFQTLEVWIENGVRAIVVDSVAALVPKAELEGDVGDAHVGRQARLMSQGLRRITGMVARQQTALVFVNQLREKVNVQYGSPETTPGGRSLKYYATLRLDCRRGEPIKEKDRQVGTHIKVKTNKNRGTAQYRTRQVPLVYGIGLDNVRELVEIGTDAGLIQRAGAWYSYGDIRVQGEAAMVEAVRESAAAQDRLRPRVAEFLETGEVSDVSEAAA